MSDLLNDLISRLNRIRRIAGVAELTIRSVRAILLAGIVLGLWALVQPDQQSVQLLLMLLAILLGMTLGSKKRTAAIHGDHVLFEMEINHPTTRQTPFRLKDPLPSKTTEDEWGPRCEQEVRAFRAYEIRRLAHMLSTLPIPALLMLLIAETSPGSIRAALSNVSRAVTQLGRGATLTIIDGAPTDDAKKPIRLNPSETAKLEVLAQNMIEIKIVGAAPSRSLRVDLKKRIPGKAVDPANPVFQSFRLSQQRGSDAPDTDIYSIAFAVTDDVEVYLPFVSEAQPVAEIMVRQLPTPKVRLEAMQKLREPWPDDQAIPLRIDVTAENPLQLVRLLIRTGGKTSTELVTNVMATDKKELSSDYNLLLESYVQSDIAEVEIIAEAVDRSLPLPLIGQSQPLIVKTASAFGRYRETLQTLREIKNHLDEAVSKQIPKLGEEVSRLVELAMTQSQDSPFFDSLDRLVINRIEQQLRENLAAPDMAKVVEASETLNDFLFEHEILDDKERDRDFFVAARALSRLIEQKPKDRSIDMPSTVNRVKEFLDDRAKRWVMRVERLPKDFQPKSWPRIEKRPFHAAMDQIGALDARNIKLGKSDSLTLLSQTVTQYREWIEELEEREEASRSAEESKRQQGLSNARDQIRDLQKRQGQISTSLDQAATRPEAELSQEWPTTRMNQNANVKGTSGLEAQLRSLSPTAGERVKAALESMRKVVDAGNEKGFDQAESSSDLAGRLLRQAESATRKSQQKNQRGRRKRVTGDNYYGQQITGGDVEIKREYEVNRRYREDVLEEVGRYESDSDDQSEASVLENYLRRVIR